MVTQHSKSPAIDASCLLLHKASCVSGVVEVLSSRLAYREGSHTKYSSHAVMVRVRRPRGEGGTQTLFKHDSIA